MDRIGFGTGAVMGEAQPALVQRSVLVIDPDPLHRVVMTDVLTGLGAPALSAGDAAEAATCLSLAAPALVLVERGAGPCDARALAAIRKALSPWRVPVVAMLDPEDARGRHEALADGFDGVLFKPVAVSDLFELLAAAGLRRPLPSGSDETALCH